MLIKPLLVSRFRVNTPSRRGVPQYPNKAYKAALLEGRGVMGLDRVHADVGLSLDYKTVTLDIGQGTDWVKSFELSRRDAYEIGRGLILMADLCGDLKPVDEKISNIEVEK